MNVLLDAPNRAYKTEWDTEQELLMICQEKPDQELWARMFALETQNVLMTASNLFSRLLLQRKLTARAERQLQQKEKQSRAH